MYENCCCKECEEMIELQVGSELWVHQLCAACADDMGIVW